jgi:hypothetical protein
MTEPEDQLLEAVNEIRDLVRLMAEPAIAELDCKLREQLRRVVGTSPQKARSVLAMDGSRTQKDICSKAEINDGNLSTFVKQLKGASLLVGDPKRPKLAIPVPANFFEGDKK